MPQPRPINSDTITDAARELRAFADQPLTYARLKPTTALFVAGLLEMPVGVLLAQAEAVGQSRAREIGEVASECDDGICPITTAVTEALLEAGPWAEIDGDGSVADVLAGHVRELGRWYRLGRVVVRYLQGGAGDAIPSAVAELADLFTAIEEKHSHTGEPLTSQVKRLADFILDNVPGEPSRSEGAIDTAIRVLRELGHGGPFPPQHWTAIPGWLEVTQTHRGFKQLPKLQAVHGGQPSGHVQVMESSAASGPYVWLSVTDLNPATGRENTAAAHLALSELAKLRDQCTYLLENHYQLGQGDDVRTLGASVRVERADGTVDDLGPMTRETDDPPPIPRADPPEAEPLPMWRYDGSPAGEQGLTDWVKENGGMVITDGAGWLRIRPYPGASSDGYGPDWPPVNTGDIVVLEEPGVFSVRYPKDQPGPTSESEAR